MVESQGSSTSINSLCERMAIILFKRQSTVISSSFSRQTPVFPISLMSKRSESSLEEV